MKKMVQQKNKARSKSLGGNLQRAGGGNKGRRGGIGQADHREGSHDHRGYTSGYHKGNFRDNRGAGNRNSGHMGRNLGRQTENARGRGDSGDERRKKKGYPKKVPKGGGRYDSGGDFRSRHDQHNNQRTPQLSRSSRGYKRGSKRKAVKAVRDDVSFSRRGDGGFTSGRIDSKMSFRSPLRLHDSEHSNAQRTEKSKFPKKQVSEGRYSKKSRGKSGYVRGRDRGKKKRLSDTYAGSRSRPSAESCSRSPGSREVDGADVVSVASQASVIARSCDHHQVSEIYSFTETGLRSLEEYLKSPHALVREVICDERSWDRVHELLARYNQVRPPWLEKKYEVYKHLAKTPGRGGEGDDEVAVLSGSFVDVIAAPSLPCRGGERYTHMVQMRFEIAQYNSVFLATQLHPSSSPRVIVMLDHLEDPRNVGAIIRSASFFGAPMIIVPQNRQATLGDAWVRCSRGGLGHVRWVSVVNLIGTLKILKDHGYWVLGADMDGEPVSEISGFYDKTVLILGSEGAGISRLLRSKCDRMLRVSSGQTWGQYEGGSWASSCGVTSLNVSVAAGILLHELGKT